MNDSSQNLIKESASKSINQGSDIFKNTILSLSQIKPSDNKKNEDINSLKN